MILTPNTSTSLETAVTASHAEFAAAMSTGYWLFTSNTNCWIKQASPTGTITCDTNANMADADSVTINDGINAAKVYEYDKAADGVAGGHVVWAAGTTAASNAASLAALITANQPYITVVDNKDGTLSLSSTSRNITLTKSSASGLAVTFGPIATKAALSMFVPANMILPIDATLGSNLSVLRDSADGAATLTRATRF